MCAVSVLVAFKNLRRAGTALKSCATSMTVPTGIPQSFRSRSFPPFTVISVPCSALASRVRKTKRETEAIDGRASPRNPKLAIVSRSAVSRILLVACRSSESSAASGAIPLPLSSTRM